MHFYCNYTLSMQTISLKDKAFSEAATFPEIWLEISLF